MNQSPQSAPLPNPPPPQCPWDTMGLSTRLSCVMSIFPRRLWGYIITEPMFSPEEMYEVDAYFGYSRRYHNLQPRTYWDQTTPPPGCYNDPRFQLPQMSFVHHVVNHHNVSIIAHEYPKGAEAPPTPVSPKTQDGENSPDISKNSGSSSPIKSDNTKVGKETDTAANSPIKRKTSMQKKEEGEPKPGKRVKLEHECKQEPEEPAAPADVEITTQ